MPIPARAGPVTGGPFSSRHDSVSSPSPSSRQSSATHPSGTDSAPCELAQLVDTALAPFRAGDNFMLSGPPCQLPRDACVPLSLALHELCTNAVKYGALSGPKGWVTLDWTLGRDGLLTLAWREENGPRVSGPAREGMGTQLLKRQRGLDHVELHYRPGGVECTIVIENCAGL